MNRVYGSHFAERKPLSRAGYVNFPRLPTMRETQVQSLGWEDLLDKEMALQYSCLEYSSILAWKVPWMEKPGRLQSMGSQRVGHN